MAFSNYYAASVLDAQTNVNISLHTADPGSDGLLNEVNGGSYARIPAVFAQSAGKTNANNADVAFVDMPGVTVTHFVQWDQSSNAIWVAPLTQAFVIQAGQTLTFQPGDLTNTLT